MKNLIKKKEKNRKIRERSLNRSICQYVKNKEKFYVIVQSN